MIRIIRDFFQEDAYSIKHSNQIFNVALDFYKKSPSHFDKCVNVIDDYGNYMYSLRYEKNQVNPLDYVSDFWKYDKNDENIDLELIQRGEVFIFLSFEEYTYISAQIIRERYPEKYIFFTDKMASLFFDQTDHMVILNGFEDFFNKYRNFLSKVIFIIDSSKEYLPNHVRCIVKRYRSLEFMSGLFWKCDVHSYGELHADKFFYLIKNPLNSAGMTDLIKFTLYRVMMADFKGLIPVIDLSVKGDENQFNGGDGRNAWTMYFEQVSPYSLEEVYQSKNVIQSVDQLDFFNPYVQEFAYLANEKIMLNKYLRYNESTSKYIEKVYRELIPKNSVGLGVIGRGTDYRSNKARWVPKPSEPLKLIQRVEAYIKNHLVDYIFLATEDEIVYRYFMESRLKNKIICVEQERINYSEEDKELFLSDIYKKKKFDGYSFNLKYLSILNILSKCDSLISGCYCGAFRIAEALNNGKYKDAILVEDGS